MRVSDSPWLHSQPCRPGRLLTLGVVLALLVGAEATHGGITLRNRFTNVDCTACSNADLVCELKEGTEETLLGAHSVKRTATASGAKGSATAVADIGTQATLDPAGDVLEFTANVTGSTRASGGDESLVSAAGSEADATLVGKYQGGEQKFSITGAINIPKARVITGTRNRCIVRIRAQSQTVFEQVLQGEGTRILSGSGTMPSPGLGGEGSFEVFVDFDSFAVSGGSTNPGSDDASASINFTVKIEPLATPPTDIRWINANGGSFQAASNWDPEDVPDGSDSALFDFPGAYAIRFDGSVVHSKLQVHGSGVNVTLDLSGRSYTLDELQTGGLPGDDVSLTLQGGGGIVSVAAFGAESPAPTPAEIVTTPLLNVSTGGRQFYTEGARGSATTVNVEGELTIDGVGSTLDTTDLKVAITSDRGLLLLRDSATLTSGSAVLAVNPGNLFTPQSNGAVLVQLGSTWEVNSTLIVGQGGQGTVSVTGGSRVVSRGTCVLGDEEDSIGRINVRDPLSVFQGTTVTLGREGLGELNVLTQGEAQISFLRIGDVFTQDPGTGVVTVKDFDSNLTVSTELSIGGAGTGTLVVEDGGAVSQGQGSTRRVVIKENGKALFRTAAFGNLGDLSIASGGEFNVNDAIVVTRDTTIAPGGTLHSDVSGQFSVEEGFLGIAFLEVNGTARVASTGSIVVGEGQRVAGKLRIGPKGVLQGAGTVIATEILIAGSGSNQFSGGQLQPGNSPGTLTLDGNLVHETGGEIVLEIGGTAPGEHDRLVIQGNATFGGKLVLRFLDDFVPRQGDQFTLISITGSSTGSFSDVEIRGLEPGFEFDLAANTNGEFVVTALNDGVPLSSKGLYRGVLTGEPPGHESAGIFDARINGRGVFTARFVLGGRKYALKGRFDADGNFSSVITRKGDTPLTVNLALAVVDDARVITGTILDGEHTIALTADRTKVFKTKTNPAPQAGQYTALFQFDPSDPDAPQANGFGVVKVAKSGAVKFAGKLADGTPISQGSALSRDGTWPLFVLLYKKQGSIVGEVHFRNLPGSDFDGAVIWSRPETPDHPFVKNGFVTALAAIGSRYAAPPTVPAILTLPNGATASMGDVDLTPPLTRALSLINGVEFGVIDASPALFTLEVNVTDGLLSGQFAHPTAGELPKLQGVVFQKQNRGSGFFLRPGVVGAFELKANQ